jgi:hypothetical protein
MGHATAQKRITTATKAAREPVPAGVYDGMDFAAFNARVAEYRKLTREGGFEAALSHHAGEPVAIRTGQSL